MYNAPLHVARRFLSAHLSKELRQKHGKRNLMLRKGDTVKIMVGQFKKKIGLVENVDVKHKKVFVENVYAVKKDGTKLPRAVHPSNLMITILNLEDKVRKKILERK